MEKHAFLKAIQARMDKFSKAVATDEGDWIVKGFIDVYKNVYAISIDTKVISKVLELLLFPVFVDFGKEHELQIELSSQQNFYPDISFVHKSTNRKFALDIKSAYRTSETAVNGMTLGAFTGYFRNRDSSKNIRYPYNAYEGHYVLGVVYSQNKMDHNECPKYTLDTFHKIPSVIRNFTFFAQPKYKIASTRPGSGNTKNIGSCTLVDDLVKGAGPFNKLGEDVYDDYWMCYLTEGMAKSLEMQRPYTNIKEYFEYKKRGITALKKHEKEIKRLSRKKSAG